MLVLIYYIIILLVKYDKELDSNDSLPKNFKDHLVINDESKAEYELNRLKFQIVDLILGVFGFTAILIALFDVINKL